MTDPCSTSECVLATAIRDRSRPETTPPGVLLGQVRDADPSLVVVEHDVGEQSGIIRQKSMSRDSMTHRRVVRLSKHTIFTGNGQIRA